MINPQDVESRIAKARKICEEFRCYCAKQAVEGRPNISRVGPYEEVLPKKRVKFPLDLNRPWDDNWLPQPVERISATVPRLSRVSPSS